MKSHLFLLALITVTAVAGIFDHHKIKKLERAHRILAFQVESNAMTEFVLRYNRTNAAQSSRWIDASLFTNQNTGLTWNPPFFGLCEDGSVVWRDRWTMERIEAEKREQERQQQWQRLVIRIWTNDGVVYFTNFNGKVDPLWTNDANGRPRL